MMVRGWAGVGGYRAPTQQYAQIRNSPRSLTREELDAQFGYAPQPSSDGSEKPKTSTKQVAKPKPKPKPTPKAKAPAPTPRPPAPTAPAPVANSGSPIGGGGTVVSPSMEALAGGSTADGVGGMGDTGSAQMINAPSRVRQGIGTRMMPQGSASLAALRRIY